MKKLLPLILTFLFLLLLPSSIFGGNIPSSNGYFAGAGLIQNETIVALADDISFGKAVGQGSFAGAKIINSYAPMHLLRLDYPYRSAASDTPFRRACLQSSGQISPNFMRYAHLTPDDPRFGSQTYLKPIKAPEAWDLFRGDASVTVALIDTGIDIDHPDLQANIIGGTNLRPGEDSNDYNDPHGHGTAVAGIIGATTNNSEGIAGICWNVRLLIIRVLGGEDLTTTLFEEAAAIDYAIAHGARVINMSFGGPGTSSAEQKAIEKAKQAGVIMVASAGNNGVYGDLQTAPEGLNYPAAYPDVIGVGALKSDLYKADFSNYGVDQCEFVTVGVSVYTTLPRGIGDISGPILIGREYGWATGTSFAAPQVTALTALLIMKEPWLTAGQIKDRLKANAGGLGGPDADGDGVDDYFGYGLIKCDYTLADSPVGNNGAIKAGVFPSPVFPERVYVYVQTLKKIDSGSLAIIGLPESGPALTAEVRSLETGDYIGSLIWPATLGQLRIEIKASNGGVEYPRLLATYKP